MRNAGKPRRVGQPAVLLPALALAVHSLLLHELALSIHCTILLLFLCFPTCLCRATQLAAEAEARRQALVPLAEQLVTAPTASTADVRGAARLLADIAGRQHAQR